MIWDRFVGYVIKARGVLTWYWPFMVAVAVTANMVVLVLLVVRQADALEETREQTLINRRLIERGNPCVKGDDPTSDACLAARLAEDRVAAALHAVQAQHDEQARQLADAVDRLIELQERQHGVTQNAGASPRPPARPAPRIITIKPMPRPRPVPTATTTTVCMRNKNQPCR